MNKRKLIVWGANSYSQLGLNKISEYELPTEVNLSSIGSIKKICGGARHTIILEESGSLFIAGKCEFSTAEYEGTFRKINTHHKFNDVVCGFDMTAAITLDKKIFVWGNNKNNQLGVPKMPIIKEPTELILPDNEIPLDIKFGLKQTVILTKSNKILIIGLLKHFKNCLNTSHEMVIHNSIEWLHLTPTNVTLSFENLSHFACGQNHFTIVLNESKIYSYGDNKFNQCSQIETSNKIMKFESGWTHNGYLSKSKDLFLYGRNNYGQLGKAEKSKESSILQKCTIFPVDDFALGAEHGILKSGNDLYTWGWNEHRNCGHDTDDNIVEPTLLHLSTNVNSIISVHAGAGYCMVLLEAFED